MTIDTMFRQTDFYSLSGPPGHPASVAPGPAMHEPSKVLDFNYTTHTDFTAAAAEALTMV